MDLAEQLITTQVTTTYKAWGNHLNRGDPNLKRFLVASGNIFTYYFST